MRTPNGRAVVTAGDSVFELNVFELNAATGRSACLIPTSAIETRTG